MKTLFLDEMHLEYLHRHVLHLNVDANLLLKNVVLCTLKTRYILASLKDHAFMGDRCLDSVMMMGKVAFLSK